jgi:hypothetical protein
VLVSAALKMKKDQMIIKLVGEKLPYILTILRPGKIHVTRKYFPQDRGTLTGGCEASQGYTLTIEYAFHSLNK